MLDWNFDGLSKFGDPFIMFSSFDIETDDQARMAHFLQIHSGVEQVQLPEEQVPFPTRTGDPGSWENIVHEHNLLTSFAHEAENIARILRPLRPR